MLFERHAGSRRGAYGERRQIPGDVAFTILMQVVLGGDLVTCMVGSSYVGYNAYISRYPSRTVSRNSAGCMVSPTTYISYNAYTSTYPSRTVRPRWSSATL